MEQTWSCVAAHPPKDPLLTFQVISPTFSPALKTKYTLLDSPAFRNITCKVLQIRGIPRSLLFRRECPEELTKGVPQKGS